MKGVEQFGDYGVTLSFAMKTKPGNQTQHQAAGSGSDQGGFKDNTHPLRLHRPVQVGPGRGAIDDGAAAATPDANRQEETQPWRRQVRPQRNSKNKYGRPSPASRRAGFPRAEMWFPVPYV